MTKTSPVNGAVYVRISRTQLEEREVKWAAINVTLLGDNTIVAAVTGKKIRVLSIWFKAGLAVSLSIKSGNNTKIDANTFAANEAFTPSVHPNGFFVETNVGEALVFNAGVVSANVHGELNYIEV